MNRRPSGLSVAKALSGFLQYKGAEGISPRTMVAYEHDLKLWIEHAGNLDVEEVRSEHILSFLSYLRTDYVPRGIAGDNANELTPKTIYNIYVRLASFFTWASREFRLENPVKGVPRPRVPADPPVEPFKKEEVEALIKACDFSQEAVTDRPHSRPSRNPGGTSVAAHPLPPATAPRLSEDARTGQRASR